MDQVTYNMLFRWLICLSMDAPVWDVMVLTKKRERLFAGDVAVSLLQAVMVDPAVKPLLSSEHSSLDPTLVEPWAAIKGFRPKDGSDDPPGSRRKAERDFRGESPGTRRTPRPLIQMHRSTGSRMARRRACAQALSGPRVARRPRLAATISPWRFSISKWLMELLVDFT